MQSASNPGDVGDRADADSRAILSAGWIGEDDDNAHCPLDRCADERAEDDLLDRVLADPRSRVLELRDAAAPVAGDGQGGRRLVLRRPRRTDHDGLPVFLGRDDGAAWIAVLEPVDPAEPDGSLVSEPAGPSTSTGRRETPASGPGERPDPPEEWVGLRDIGALLGPRDVNAALTAVALASWHRTHRHCPRCGATTEVRTAGWVRRCTAEGSEHYPRTDPAVIMAVIDPDERILLARNANWDADRRSVLAGFVEPGESVEAAVAREVAEEVGLAVHDLTYVDSQPWPFPASLMLGFTARADDPVLRTDGVEITVADWFTREDLAARVAAGTLALPGRLSIARRLIEGWYGERLVPPVERPFHRRS